MTNLDGTTSVSSWKAGVLPRTEAAGTAWVVTRGVQHRRRRGALPRGPFWAAGTFFSVLGNAFGGTRWVLPGSAVVVINKADRRARRTATVLSAIVPALAVVLAVVVASFDVALALVRSHTELLVLAVVALLLLVTSLHSRRLKPSLLSHRFSSKSRMEYLTARTHVRLAPPTVNSISSATLGEEVARWR